MAEALVSVLLERLANLALDRVLEEFKLVAGVKKEVENLTLNLKHIRAVLEDAEQRQVTEASVRLWLSQLNEVSYEMDDVLDEWITRVLMTKQQKHGENARQVLSSAAIPFLSLIHRQDIAGRIKDLNERLALIEKTKQSFNFDKTTKGPQLPERQSPTTSLPGDITFGRDKEKNFILGKLLSESSSQEKGVPLIIPIIGMGGMGKTNLAQLVYNDEKVKTYFDHRLWICVSDPFEEIKIAKAIVEGLDKNSPSRNSNELQAILQCIFEIIEGKKFLLVLDDVWSPKLHQWEELIKPLRNGAMGSRILVTTRKEEVAMLMKATAQIIHLKQLSEEFCLSLFYYHAGVEISSEFKMFHDVGEEIVKKCDGLPLAAKTLGSLMSNKKTIKEWQDVLSSKIWESEEMQTNVFRSLLLSYQDFASAIKRCLLYCVTFPKDYVFDRENLIELWMAQDYLNAKGSKENNRNGQKYFDNLVMRCFFQDFEVNAIGETKCKMHDIVHDFLQYLTLQYLTKNECCTVDDGVGESERTEEANNNVYHLTLLHVRRGFKSLYEFRNCKHLRTLAAFDSPSINSIDLESIVQLKCLRTLNLGASVITKIPKEIGELIHLRYIDLSFNYVMKELPYTISSLYNLQTLRLVGCRNLMGTLDLGRVINLRNLYVDGCENLKLLKIEGLKSLQRLDTFYVQANKNEGNKFFFGKNEGNKFEDLKNLNQLQGLLTIRFPEARILKLNPSLAKSSNMVNKAHLLHLQIVFPPSNPNDVWEKETEMLNGLQPHPGLESLGISWYRGPTLCTHWWSSLSSLRRLTLRRCDQSRDLPPLGQLSSLESLHLTSLYGVEKVGVEFLGIHPSDQTFKSSFPKLKQLTINDMWCLKEWEGVDDPENSNIRIMPCLSSLTIYECKRLKALPDFLWKTPLHTLDISDSDMLQDVYGREGRWAKISHIPNIKLGKVWIQQQQDQKTDRELVNPH